MPDPASDSEYTDKLAALAATSPLVARALSSAARNRQHNLGTLVTVDDCAGFEEFLAFLHDVEDRFTTHERLGDVALLVRRAIGDFEVAIEAVLSGLNGVVFDMMRDMLEISYLLRDFASRPDNIRDWHSCSEDVRQTRYSPGAVRGRYAAMAGVEPEELLDSTMWWAYGSLVHASPCPDLMALRGICAPDRPFGAAGGYIELFLQAWYLASVLNQLARAVRPPLTLYTDIEEALPRLLAAHEQVEQAFYDERNEFTSAVVRAQIRSGQAGK